MLSPSVCDLGIDRLSWVQCQALPCLRPGTGPLDSGRASTFHWAFISFLPLWEQSERRGLPLPSQEGGERAHPSGGRAALAWWEPTQAVSVGRLDAGSYLALSPGLGGRG